MSSILDALKKSEAERQRGSPPTPTSPLVFRSQPAPRRRPPWLLPVLAAAALLLAWAGGMFQFGGESVPDGAPTGLAMAPDVGPAAGGDGAPVAAPALSTPPAPVPGDVAAAPPQPAPTPVEGAALPAPEATDDQPEVRPQRGFIDPGRAERPPPQMVTPPLIEDPAAPGNAGAAQPPAAAAAPAPPVAPVIGGGPPSLYDLPFEVRRGLPPLAVTMHMYSSDPGRRFALINGNRVHDGETMDDGVEVVEIRADGIVVRHEGTEFVLPARG